MSLLWGDAEIFHALVSCASHKQARPTHRREMECVHQRIGDAADVTEKGEQEVHAEDINALMHGRLCFDWAMPFFYYCVLPRPTLDLFPGLS